MYLCCFAKLVCKLSLIWLVSSYRIIQLQKLWQNQIKKAKLTFQCFWLLKTLLTPCSNSSHRRMRVNNSNKKKISFVTDLRCHGTKARLAHFTPKKTKKKTLSIAFTRNQYIYSEILKMHRNVHQHSEGVWCDQNFFCNTA